MCLALYLFTSDSLNEIKWVEHSPGLWMRKVSRKDAEGGHIWRPDGQQAYYLGGYQGCGCGWSPVSSFDEPEESSLKQADRNSLVNLLGTPIGSKSLTRSCRLSSRQV
jgi:hypothetical protein